MDSSLEGRRYAAVLIDVRILIFGVANHFLIVSADHVSHLPAGQWVLPFQVTAVLLALTESVGCLVGLAALLAKDRA